MAAREEPMPNKLSCHWIEDINSKSRDAIFLQQNVRTYKATNGLRAKRWLCGKQGHEAHNSRSCELGMIQWA